MTADGEDDKIFESVEKEWEGSTDKTETEDEFNDKFQRLNLFFEKENVGSLFVISKDRWSNCSDVNSRSAKPMYSPVKTIYELSVIKFWRSKGKRERINWTKLLRKLADRHQLHRRRKIF